VARRLTVEGQIVDADEVVVGRAHQVDLEHGARAQAGFQIGAQMRGLAPPLAQAVPLETNR
jgi:hypothetical protein